MSKNILIISTSPRFNSNSDLLAQSFEKGALEAGHFVERVTLRDKTIQFCKGCLSCVKTQKCVIHDDVNEIVEKMKEADVLVQLSDGQENILSSVQTIQALKKQYIASDEQLIEQFNTIAKNFSFANTSPNNAGKEESAISKSISLIKDTVSGLNFDKIVVVKKQNRTAAQEQLIAQLTALVNQHNFTGALDFIRSHQDFSLLETQDLSKWQADVKRRISFDSAISQIISAELSSIRQSLINTQTPAEP